MFLLSFLAYGEREKKQQNETIRLLWFRERVLNKRYVYYGFASLGQTHVFTAFV